MSLPTFFVENLKNKVVALGFPLWQLTAKKEEAHIQKLQVENHLLKIELVKLKAKLHDPTNAVENVVCAHVIYRNPHSWGSSFWVDVGEGVVVKNSPVLSGGAIVGIVDYVGKKQSKIRLITDRGLKPSVRAVRGSLQNAQLFEHLESVLHHLQARADLPLEEKSQFELIAALENFQSKLALDLTNLYLAKGILEGGGPPLWRSRNHVLKGIGFNYDFSDSYGPARPLVSKEDPPILQAQDLLVTTGMDGVFPPGLRVAEVSRVFPLCEGAYAYEIEAIPVVKNLDSIQTVFIIPPISDEDSYSERDGSY